ncbi:MAG: nucleotide exchange factor GrpE [Lachnospiraceae bacterium]|nr:nucleotide exchange factor GrpE [Lachnospiraceae bacterium]
MQQEAVSEEKVNEANTEAEADVEAEKTEETKEASGGKDEKKKKKADKKEQAYEEKIAELNDRVMRQMAEFDNYRKRTEKEKSQMFEIGAKDIIEKVLPVVDNFERGLSALSEEEKESAFAQGIEKIYKQLTQVLADAGVEPIEAVGKEFNPDFHNAVMHAEDENLGENIVAEEFQKGYTYRGSVVRHSMVKVVN